MELSDRIARARRNIAIHVTRGIGRIVALLLVDGLAFLTLQLLWRAHAKIWTTHATAWREVATLAKADHTQIAAALLIGLVAVGTYGAGDSRRSGKLVLGGCALGLALPVWEAFWLAPTLALRQYIALVALSSAVVLLGRLALDQFIRRYLPHPRARRRTLVIGHADEMQELLDKSPLLDPTAFNVVGRMDLSRLPKQGLRQELDATLVEYRSDSILICGTPSEKIFREVVHSAASSECQIFWASALFDAAGARPSVALRKGRAFIELRAPMLRAQQLLAKRALDVILSSIMIVALAPVLALVAILVRLESRGPILFRQLRPGLGGRPFAVMKFRTMRADADEVLRADPVLYKKFLDNGCKLSSDEDPRISRLGRILRASSLDELPQLFNVVKGDMSLVGPRPVVGPELAEYGELSGILLSVRPGITGRWQVSGRSSLPLRERVRIDMEYISTWSVSRDLAILLLTVPAVLNRRGAY